MTTLIRARCVTCGPVDLRPHHVTLHLSTNAPQHSTYAFHCPRCEHLRLLPADAHTIALLLTADVPVTRIHLPLEVLEPHRGGVITSDDVLDFALGDLDRALELLAGATWNRAA